MDQPAVPNIADLDMMSLKRFVKGLYFALLLLTVALTAIGIYLGYVESLILTLPIIVIIKFFLTVTVALAVTVTVIAQCLIVIHHVSRLFAVNIRKRNGNLFRVFRAVAFFGYDFKSVIV